MVGARPLAEVEFAPSDAVLIVVCACGQRIGAVSDAAKPWLTVWTPTVSVRRGRSGAPYFTEAAGPITAGEVATLHCRQCGRRWLDAEQVWSQVARVSARRQKSTRHRSRLVAASTPPPGLC